MRAKGKREEEEENRREGRIEVEEVKRRGEKRRGKDTRLDEIR